MREPRDLQRRPRRLPNVEYTVRRIVVSDHHVLDLGLSRTGPTNSASSTHCFKTNSYWFSMLELMKYPSSPRSIRHPAGPEYRSVHTASRAASGGGCVAAAWAPLARYWLAARIDPADMRSDRAAQTLGIAHPVPVHVFEVVQLLRWNSLCERIRVGR
jgi:hypothetical protein